jgi:hypothetical protein
MHAPLGLCTDQFTSVDYNISADAKVGEPKPETMLGVQVIEVNAGAGGRSGREKSNGHRLLRTGVGHVC